MNPIPYPSSLIPQTLTDEIIHLSAEAERLGALHPRQLSLIYDQKWFKLFVPRDRGGLEMSLPEALRLEEALAWTDGSLGWTVTLCGGANWFIGIIPPESGAALFDDPKVCLAGSGHDSGIARITPNGYEISGRWRYATGAPHATAFTANCRIEKDGKLLQDEQGHPLVHAFLLAKEEVIIHEDWHAIGMIATASHSFEVRQQQVPAARCFRIDGNNSFLSQPIYRYPFLQLAETTLAVNSSGMAARFIDLAEKLGKERTEDPKTRLQELRQNFYKLAEASWQDCTADRPISAIMMDELSDASRRLASGARRIVDDLYPSCGLTAADPCTEINRVWRNLHTASQHSLLLQRV